VATNIGGFREYIEDGVTGLLSPPKEPKALAENICRLLGNEPLRVRLAKACNSYIAGLSWERSTDLLENFLNNVTQPRTVDLQGVLS
jgi:glycosyltransferase involved in cell wall biosynthesis